MSSNKSSDDRIKLWIGITIGFLIIFTVILHTSWTNSNQSFDQMSNTNSSQLSLLECDSNVRCEDFMKLDSGFDDKALKIYKETKDHIESEIFEHGQSSLLRIDTVPLSSSSSFQVYSRPFWNGIQKIPKWEKETFEIYFNYINSNTILIDFGTWIGPTILYGISFAYEAYGIEADPAALSEMEINVKLNSDKLWYTNNKLHIQGGCVSTPNDTGIIEMKSHQPGNSCSGIAQKVGCGKVEYKWNVRCYTLDYLLKHWNIQNYWKYQKNMFIKIDIESYECKLIPTFYNWLIKIPQIFLPTFYISYHPQIQLCTNDEYFGFAKVIKLYKISICHLNNILIINHTTSINTIFHHVKQCNQFKKGSIFILTTII